MKLRTIILCIYLSINVLILAGCQKPVQTLTPPGRTVISGATTISTPVTVPPATEPAAMSTPRPVLVQGTANPTAVEIPMTPGEVLFDDFNYDNQQSMTENGWTIRDKAGWPGAPGATWPIENISFVADPDQPGNILLQMLSSTDGTAAGTQQAQVCHQRKYLDGTYATRLYFTEEPLIGPDGDQIVETFYMISPFTVPLDPDYSELDNEYLPNGGWNYKEHAYAVTSWEKVQIDPWIADNDSDTMPDVTPGWHTIVMQVMNGKVNYLLDGQLITTHLGKYYPEVPMSINYNLWFVNGGLLKSSVTRQYFELVDWVYFEAGKTVFPYEVTDRVNALRGANIQYQDTVPEWNPPLPSPCDM